MGQKESLENNVIHFPPNGSSLHKYIGPIILSLALLVWNITTIGNVLGPFIVSS